MLVVDSNLKPRSTFVLPAASAFEASGLIFVENVVRETIRLGVVTL